MTVVLNAGGGGVLFHEACGHGLEADAIGKDTTGYAGTRGDKVGSELFSGVDDPTVVGAWAPTGSTTRALRPPVPPCSTRASRPA